MSARSVRLNFDNTCAFFDDVEEVLPTELKRLKQLEDEDGKLRKLVADLSLDKEMLQDVIRRKL